MICDFFCSETSTPFAFPTFGFRKPHSLTFGRHSEMEKSLQHYAMNNQPWSMGNRTERLTITRAMWRVANGISPSAYDNSQLPPMDPNFQLGMMGSDRRSVKGCERGALRVYWTTYAIPYRIKGCQIEREKAEPNPSKFCGLAQNIRDRRNNNMRNICEFCNNEVNGIDCE